MAEERVKMRLQAEMDELVVVVMEQVRENAKNLRVNALNNAEEVRRKGHPLFCGEQGGVVQLSRDPGKRVVDVSCCRQSGWLFVGVYPQVVVTRASGHDVTLVDVVTEDLDELGNAVVELKNIESEPLVLIDVSWKLDYCLETPLYEGCTVKWLSEEKRGALLG